METESRPAGKDKARRVRPLARSAMPAAITSAVVSCILWRPADVVVAEDREMATFNYFVPSSQACRARFYDTGSRRQRVGPLGYHYSVGRRLLRPAADWIIRPVRSM